MDRSSRRYGLPGLISPLLIAFSLANPSALTAQEPPVPIRDQYLIFLKALTYDRNLRTRCADTVKLGVLYQSTYHQSENAREQLMSIGRELASLHVDGLPVRIIPIDLSTGKNLEAEVRAHRVNTLYVTPMRSLDMKRISSMTRKDKMLTLTGVTAYVERGLSLGVESRGGRASLVVNRRASLAEGADFTSQLLELVRIVR